MARAAYCERILHSEIQLGVEQYVILGAGFDTFPYRQQQGQTMLEIFEVDYPATQASKMKRLQEASLPLESSAFCTDGFYKAISISIIFRARLSI